jgi:hypothetical protein
MRIINLTYPRPGLPDIKNHHSHLIKPSAKSTLTLTIPISHKPSGIQNSSAAFSQATTGSTSTRATSHNPAIKNIAAISDTKSELSLATNSLVSMTNRYNTSTNEDGESGYTSAGGLSNNNKMHGTKREAAISSPLKGKQHLTSLVYSLRI